MGVQVQVQAPRAQRLRLWCKCRHALPRRRVDPRNRSWEQHSLGRRQPPPQRMGHPSSGNELPQALGHRTLIHLGQRTMVSHRF